MPPHTPPTRCGACRAPTSRRWAWYARGYHGSYQHNSRAVIQRYLGFWDLNPATLVPLSPEDSAPLYVEMMGGADFVRGTSTGLFLDYLGIQMDSRKAEGLHFKINRVTPDNGERFAVELSKATLTNIAGYQAPDPDLTITIDRRELEDVMIGAARLADKVADGRCWMDGNAQVLAQLAATLVQFDPWFEVLPGTKAPAPLPTKAEALADDAPVELRP